ncbi:hypothetical protein ACHAQJ_008943 [Trichoderma viride]
MAEEGLETHTSTKDSSETQLEARKTDGEGLKRASEGLVAFEAAHDESEKEQRGPSRSSARAYPDVQTAETDLNRTISRVPTLSKNHAILYMVVTVLTQLVQMMDFGAGIVSASIIGKDLGATPAEATWIAASYPVTQGSFVLVSGRLGAVFGHKKLLTIGCIWWIFWNMATAAYGGTIISVSVMRALAGIGGGLMVPNAVAFATLGLVVYGIAILVIPDDSPLDPTGAIDWVGSYLALGGLIMFNIVWNQAPAVGWQKPYEYILLIIAILHFAGFVLWEAKFAEVPILPVDLWKAPSFGTITAVLFLVFMSLGIYLWYATVFLLNIRNFKPVILGCAWLPMAIAGVGAAFLAAWAVPRMPAQILVAFGCIGAALMNILLSTTPVHQTYWAMFFPAMILVAFTGDMVFAAGQIIASSGVARRHQGAAGSFIGTLFTYGMSTGLGFAGTVERYTDADGTNLLGGYRAAVYLGIGFAVGGLIIDLLFVRMKKNTTEGW